MSVGRGMIGERREDSKAEESQMGMENGDGRTGLRAMVGTVEGVKKMKKIEFPR